MEISPHLPGYRWFDIFRNPAVRLGVYTGVGLTLVFTVWLIAANRVSMLEPFAFPRNIIAAILLALFSLLPVFRFLWMPGNLLASSLTGWLIFTTSYRLLCVFFRDLAGWHSPFQVFMLGAIVYMIVTTLSWIVTVIWRARGADISHPNNHAS